MNARPPRRLAGLALGLALVAARPTRAEGVVALADGKVPQYREALGTAREVLHNPPVIDSDATDAVEQIRRADPAVVLAIGQKALQAAKLAVPQRPIIFCMVLGSTATATRSITGLRLEVPPSVQLEQFKEVHPGAHRVGVIYDPHNSAGFMQDAVKSAGRLGVTLVSKPISQAREVRGALGEIAGSIDALWLMPDPHLITPEIFNYLLVFTLERKIALFGFLDSLTQAGALASVAPDYQEIGRRAARVAAEVAAKPAEGRLPVPAPQGSPGALTVNLRTAKQLGLDVPPGVLSRARQIFR
jgi:putative ABC transport system substrate-binding protein